MKKLSLILFILFTHLTLTPLAHADTPPKGAIYVKVNGLVCDFCSRSLERVLNKQDAIKKINVNLDKSLVTIYTQETMNIDNATITKLVKDSGYDVADITRPAE